MLWSAPESILVTTADGFSYGSIFKVADLGLAAALAGARVNGGGVVEFAAGRFKMSGPIDLPSLTVLRGAGMSKTSRASRCSPSRRIAVLINYELRSVVG